MRGRNSEISEHSEGILLVGRRWLLWGQVSFHDRFSSANGLIRKKIRHINIINKHLASLCARVKKIQIGWTNQAQLSDARESSWRVVNKKLSFKSFYFSEFIYQRKQKNPRYFTLFFLNQLLRHKEIDGMIFEKAWQVRQTWIYRKPCQTLKTKKFSIFRFNCENSSGFKLKSLD